MASCKSFLSAVGSPLPLPLPLLDEKVACRTLVAMLTVEEGIVW